MGTEEETVVKEKPVREAEAVGETLFKNIEVYTSR